MTKYKGVSTLEILEWAENYNEWIAEVIMEHTTAPVMEVGAGTGNITKFFLHITPFFVTEIDKTLVKRLKNKYKDRKSMFVSDLDITKTVSAANKSKFRSVFSVNVLEHIYDDEIALKNIHAMLKKKGKIILLVPAKKFAYTRLDKELGHFRRYEKEEIEKKLTNAGFIVKKIHYFNLVGLISWKVRDMVTRKSVELQPMQIKLFNMLVPLLKRIEKVIHPPIGISLIVVAEK